jgi:hypothetical protein
LPDYLTIIYEWDFPQPDLDTGTTFLGNTVGWACGGAASYIYWLSGDNTTYGPEVVEVMVRDAHTDGAWVSSVEIQCAAAWYTFAGGSGPARLRVTFNGVSSVLSISPGNQAGCVNHLVGIITVHDDWTFNLVASP